MGVIYKITNKVNGKIYIGLTTVPLSERWKNHCRSVGRVHRPLYNSMSKYGIENFIIEEIDKCEDFEELGKLERHYIKLYDSTNPDIGYNMTCGGESNQLDGNPRARLTVADVKDIRKIYSECKIGCYECWQMYKDKISYSAFEKVYEGATWKNIMPEVYTEDNKILHRTKLKSLPGEKNANAILTDEEVIKIRKYYVNHSLSECYERFGKKFKTKQSFRCIIDQSYLHLPVYSKVKKKWINEK
jgi:group I intron endonuclease